MDDVEIDNERHRREEAERRAKRQKHRGSKSKSTQQSEKERKRREHAQRILGAQKKKQPGHPPSSGQSSASAVAGGSSVFQSLFQERAEGFFIDLRFRNAPPRPPVGPTFVGLGLEGELTNKWTKYKARNAVENSYTWKLHPERDLGVPLAASAMDFEGCYEDPAKEGKGDKESDGQKSSKSQKVHALPVLPPEDEALINWKGSTGDTSAEQLQQKQDRVRAAARLAIAQGYGNMPSELDKNAAKATAKSGGNMFVGSGPRLKKHHTQSRLLDEALPHFMKKTTYLSNTATSVHQFTSLAYTQAQKAKDVDKALAETKTKYTEMDIIDMGFRDVNKFEILVVGSEGASGEKKRSHPTKKGVHPVWDLPLLPDAPTWGHTFTHVVVDNPPKNIPAKKGERVDNKFKPERLHKAIVADVTKNKENARMGCTVWAPKPLEVSESDSEPAAKKFKRGDTYRALQQYDLDVVPLRDPNAPPVQYAWTIDPTKDYAGYHFVGSRVHLSTGRPVVLTGTSHGSNTAEMETDMSYVKHRSMEDGEKKNLELKMAEVDVDLADKHGLVDDDDGFNQGRKGRNKKQTSWEQSNNASPGDDDDSDESSTDAF